MPTNSNGHISGGEHPDGRKAMREVERRLRNEGFSSEKAQQKAREAALRNDRRRNR